MTKCKNVKKKNEKIKVAVIKSCNKDIILVEIY